MTRKGWLILVSTIGIILILVLASRPRVAEGFQSYKELNVPYAQEVYVIKQNYTSQADAAAACSEKGSVLATLDQMRRARDASANWCTLQDQTPAAWIADDTSFLYYPAARGFNADTCENGGANAPCLKKRAVSTTAPQGYAACYGTKPQQGTALVDYFNETTYSIFETDLVNLTMNGEQTPAYEETMGMVFTPAQALYALEQTYTGRRYDVITARNYIKNNFNTINTSIRTAADPTPATNEDITQWADAKNRTCKNLQDLQAPLADKITQVRQTMDRVNAYTNGSIEAKDENIRLQQEVAYVCRGMTSETSPACKRLAELDYVTFYRGIDTDPTNAKVLADLEKLNVTLGARQCEIRLASSRIQRLMDALKCSEQGVAYDAASLGNNFVAALNQFYAVNPEDPCADISGDYPEFAPYVGKADTRFTAGTNVPYADSERLKLALEQLSPYFSEPGYSSLFDGMLNSLSVLLRIPELNDYSTAVDNFRKISRRTGSITEFMKGTFP